MRGQRALGCRFLLAPLLVVACSLGTRAKPACCCPSTHRCRRYVDRCGHEVRYVIDFYFDDDKAGEGGMGWDGFDYGLGAVAPLMMRFVGEGAENTFVIDLQIHCLLSLWPTPHPTPHRRLTQALPRPLTSACGLPSTRRAPRSTASKW